MVFFFFFLKIDKFEGPKSHSPLKKDQADFSGPEIIFIGYDFCINFVSKFVILFNLYDVKGNLSDPGPLFTNQ